MIDCTKPVLRRVGGLIVEVSAAGIRYREAGRRTWFGPLPHSALYLKAVQAEVDSARRTKVRKVSRGLLTTR